MLAALVEHFGIRRTLAQISQRDLQLYFAQRRKGRSDASLNREVKNTRAVWRLAASTRYDVGEMPGWADFMLRIPDPPPRELSAAEEAKFFLALRDDVSGAVDFLLKSGWRRGEVLGLRWTDLNLPAKQSRTKIKGGDIVMRPLTTTLVEIIARQPQMAPYVFTYVCQQSRAKRRKGQRYPLTSTALRKPFAQALAAAAIENFRIHYLRHTRGTRIVRATGSLAAAKEALKHRNMKTTLRYAHVMDENVRAALDASESRNNPEVGKAKSRKRLGCCGPRGYRLSRCKRDALPAELTARWRCP